MSIDYYMAVDPGKATGVAIGRLSDNDPLEVIYTAIIQGGVYGFIDWLEEVKDGKAITEMDCMTKYPKQYWEIDYHLDVVCETFQLRNNQFAANLEPLRIEGVIIDRFGSVVHWQNPSDKSMVGDQFLKDNDLWTTGNKMGHTDGRDANDALLHLFAHTMRIKHLPTLKEYWRV